MDETNIYAEFQNALILGIVAGHTQSGGEWYNCEAFEIIEAEVKSEKII